MGGRLPGQNLHTDRDGEEMNQGEWRKRDPFTDSYYWEELEFYGEHSYKDNGLELVQRDPGPIVRLDDYLNVNMKFDPPSIPTLLLDGQLWMSITPMEVQSQHVPIQRARGIAATAGLGMGHFALRAAGMDEVEEVHVFEQDPRVTACFLAVHRERKEMSKLHFHEGDAREELLKCGMRFDTLYVDIYPTLGSDDVLEDIEKLQGLADEYSWWGRELVYLNSMYYGLPAPRRPREVINLIARWCGSELGKLRHRELDREYCEAVLGALEKK